MSEFYWFVFCGGVVGTVLGLALSTVDPDGDGAWSEFCRGFDEAD